MKKAYQIINKIYGVMMFVSFFGGFLPLIPFIVAIAIGGEIGEMIAVFLYKQYYPWVIALASISVLVGLVGVYLSKQHGLSVKNVAAKENDDQKKDENEAEK